MYSPLDNLSTEEASICDKIILRPNGLSVKDIKGDDIAGMVVRLQRVSVLHTAGDRTVLEFSSPLIRSLYMQDRFGQEVLSTVPPATFEDFITGVFRNINSLTLQKSLGRGTDKRLLERSWQM